MTLFVKRFFPYFGFAGTAIGFYIASQPLICTQILIAIVFLFAISVGNKEVLVEVFTKFFLVLFGNFSRNISLYNTF